MPNTIWVVPNLKLFECWFSIDESLQPFSQNGKYFYLKSVLWSYRYNTFGLFRLPLPQLCVCLVFTSLVFKFGPTSLYRYKRAEKRPLMGKSCTCCGKCNTWKMGCRWTRGHTSRRWHMFANVLSSRPLKNVKLARSRQSSPKIKKIDVPLRR